jgi:DNA ligase-1
VEFAAFAARARAIEDEPADLDIRDLVADCLAAADDDLPIVARFLQGRIFPAWDSRTVDLGPASCYEAIARAAAGDVTADDVEDALAEAGDIGSVAAQFAPEGGTGLAAFADASQTVGAVYEELERLAAADGPGSQDTKIDGFAGLLSRSSPDEARYLARLVLGEMRIGVGGGTIRDAIAVAFLPTVEAAPAPDEDQATLDAASGTDGGDTGPPAADPEGSPADADPSPEDALPLDDAIDRVERALQVTNDHGRVAVVARDAGIDGLDALHLELGRPVDAMLAQTGTVDDALGDWECAAVEWKYDGARIQVHVGDLTDPERSARSAAAEAAAPDDIDATAPRQTGDGAGAGPAVRVFSRNMEDVTDALPEVVELARERLDKPAILDGEVVAVDENGRPRPFQDVLRRFRRKYDVEATRDEVALDCVFFDCLHHDGTDLLDAPLAERHAHLRDALGVVADEPFDHLTDPEQEGLLPVEGGGVTALATTDDAERIAAVEQAALAAGHEGVMLKNPESAYTPGRRGKNWLKRKPEVETLDCVVTGAEWGEGRRAHLLGTYELSVVTPDGYATVGHVATGLTDEELADLTERFEPLIRHEDGREVAIEPRHVVEVGYEEIQASPSTESGYALRFPRFVGVREDKDPADADSLARLEELATADGT